MNFFEKDKFEYTSEDILQQLDQCAEDLTFPMLDNGYVYPIDSRLSAYRDIKRWVLLIEVVGRLNGWLINDGNIKKTPLLSRV